MITKHTAERQLVLHKTDRRIYRGWSTTEAKPYMLSGIPVSTLIEEITVEVFVNQDGVIYAVTSIYNADTKTDKQTLTTIRDAKELYNALRTIRQGKTARSVRCFIEGAESSNEQVYLKDIKQASKLLHFKPLLYSIELDGSKYKRGSILYKLKQGDYITLP